MIPGCLRAARDFFSNIIKSRRHQRYPADFIIIGIGNKGSKYACTRHNIGFMVADRLVEILKSSKSFRAINAVCTAGILEGETRVVAAKPQTFVNASGFAVRDLCDITGCDAKRCLVIVDDFNLALGKIRLRRDGSDGGHNGLKSIISEIGTGFPRIRVGIGPLPAGMSSIDFVLGKFDHVDMAVVSEAVKKAADAVEYFCKSGIDAAMNKYNNQA